MLHRNMRDWATDARVREGWSLQRRRRRGGRRAPWMTPRLRGNVIEEQRNTSHVTRHTLHVARHTLHATRHASHVTCIAGGRGGEGRPRPRKQK